MLKEQRRQQILELLKRDGQVEISVIRKLFNVTEMTIRRDLDSLAESYEIVRTHGGAMLSDIQDSIEPPYESRIASQGNQKREIALKALSFIKYRQTVFLDSGSTTYYMAQNIGNDKINTVLTTGVNLVPELLNRQNISAIMIGGDLRRNTISTCGPLAEEQLNRFRVDVAFLGANGVGEDGNVYIGNTTESGIKNTVMEIAQETYLLVDSSKFGSSHFLHYANLTDFTGVITDKELPEKDVNRLRKIGANIIIA
ncbi:DeoR/GlpR family DNA-binding transcription regulator [Lachnospiraceae bacterium OttesenSCG-928-E19]|nr:DeoR/GlpR family DNA-binding transcription regulator [Lachnospiraceae bacterium OttesenSCG-928-E19]